MPMDRLSRTAEIERLLVWKGRINNLDVAKVTGISVSTAADDLRRYAKNHPRNIRKIAIFGRNNRVARYYEPRPCFRAVYFQVLSPEQFADLATDDMPIVREVDRVFAGVFPALAAALRTKAVVRLMTGQGERIGIPLGFRRVAGVWNVDLYAGGREPMMVPLASVSEVGPSGEVTARPIREGYVAMRQRERIEQAAAADQETTRKRAEVAQVPSAEARAMATLKCKSEEWIRRGFARKAESRMEKSNAHA